VYAYFQELGYAIALLEDWLGRKAPLNLEEFSEQFHGGINHYFLAYAR
jgi:hypothetical protein